MQFDFPVRHEIMIKGLVFKSAQMSEGFENIELILDQQEHQLSNASGQFSFKAKPGKHVLSINSLSIPAGYSLQGPIKIEIESEESISLNIFFQPQISLRGIVYDESTRKTVGNLQLFLKYSQDGQEHEEKIDVNADGTFFAPNVPDGLLELHSTRRKEPLLIQIPPEPGTFKVAFPIN